MFRWPNMTLQRCGAPACLALEKETMHDAVSGAGVYAHAAKIFSIIHRALTNKKKELGGKEKQTQLECFSRPVSQISGAR